MQFEANSKQQKALYFFCTETLSDVARRRRFRLLLAARRFVIDADDLALVIGLVDSNAVECELERRADKRIERYLSNVRV